MNSSTRRYRVTKGASAPFFVQGLMPTLDRAARLVCPPYNFSMNQHELMQTGKTRWEYGGETVAIEAAPA